MQNIYIGPLTEKDYSNLIRSKIINKTNIPYAAVKTLPSIRLLDEIVSIPHLLYWKDIYWKNNIKLKHIENELFNCCNKLYI